MATTFPLISEPRDETTHLLLVRHGRTAANRKGILQGHLDLPLDDFGRMQAERVAARIAAEHAPTLLITSPLSRAATTAGIIGDRVGLTAVPHPGLMEMNCGDVEGRTFDDFVADFPDLVPRIRDPHDLDFAWPGGESRRVFHDRVHATFREIVERHAGETVVVVAHGGVLGALLTMVRGIPPGSEEAYSLVNCGLSHLEVGPEVVYRFHNDGAHLEGLVDPLAADPVRP